ncbi:HAMP domain-containing sensor histidine kinase [uncultured Intestinimonas sp.]|uniref:sensor histidine kinase n=1 Tax=uncultured Intestinimonas sp. TaxID=1689265 RepID=UPI00260014CA|nr:HAMP domain-containing sensor histidine kinase [uncultured Intestinimonas sp.]
MIRKLRRKFVLTNMLLVALVLLMVFAALVASNYQRLANQSRTALRAALLWSDEGPDRFEFAAGPPEEASRVFMVPVFTVTLDENGEAAEVMGGGNVSVSSETVELAVALAQGEEGVIPELDLRYLRETGPDGETRIAFADRGWERSTLWSMVGSFLLVGALALGAFFLISLLLSGLALQPAERAWEQQRRFVADASHELKTPLTVILTNTGILLRHPEQTVAQQRKWVEYIREEAQRMRELVEDLLFLARHDAGRDQAPAQTVDLAELLWSALLPFEPVAFEQGVTLESGIQSGVTVRGRSEELRRLAAILLDNAVKYAGPQGQVRVALARGEKGGACLTVRNTGPAIPPEHLEHLFERFYRADNSRARSSGGYGLGLAIAKSIVDSHRGTITVQSREEEGTCFTVRLPG